jgi:hypothetical protein
MAWSATRTERNQQACHKGDDPGSRMPFRGRSGDIHEGITFVFQEKPVVFRLLNKPLYFQAIAVVRGAPGPGTGYRLSGFCAFSHASKKHGFFAIKTGIF